MCFVRMEYFKFILYEDFYNNHAKNEIKIALSKLNLEF